VFHASGWFGSEVASIYKELFGIPVFITAKSNKICIDPIRLTSTMPAVGVVRATDAKKNALDVMTLMATDMAAISLQTSNKLITNMAMSMKKKYKSNISEAYASVVLKLLGVDGQNNCGDFYTVVHNSTNMLSEEF
jgi:hypothetical protein